MKHNWGYKKIDELGAIKSGYTPSSEELASHGDYPYFKVAEMNLPGNEKYLMHSPSYLSGEIKTFPANSIVFPKNGAAVSTNKKRILQVDSVVDLNTAVMIVNQSISVNYLYYILINIDFANLVKRGAVPTLNISELKSTIVPVPPIEVQEQIVAEFDQINDLIAKNRELLSQLDALAQSLFYDSFGDPISNPKGWTIKKLSSVSELINGRAYKQNELLDSGKYRVIRVGNFFTNSDYYYSNLELPAEKYIDTGDLIFAWSASFGAFIWRGEKVIYHYHIWKVLFDEKTLNKIFYKFLLNEMTSLFMKDLHGIGMMHLTKAGMEQYLLPVPPLALQEDFAAKVEAIEAQKEKVEAVITELQTLLDARMDYWFN